MKRLFFILTLLFVTLSCLAQSRYISERTKKIVYARDGGACRCCGSSSNIEFDHVTPYSCGGNSSPSNIQLLCMRCNRSKSNSCFCKIHDRKVGTNCCAGRATNSSSAVAVQCSGTTQKGTRCKRRTTSPTGRCHSH